MYEYKHIEPLLESCNIEGDTVTCIFRCRESDMPISSFTFIKGPGIPFPAPGDDEGILKSVRFAIFRLAGNVVNYFFHSLLYSIRDDTTEGPVSEDSHRRKAVIRAFTKVSRFFRLDHDRGYYVFDRKGWDLASDFEKLFSSLSMMSKKELESFRKILISMALADKKISDEERTFLSDFISLKSGRNDSLAREGLPGADDLKNVSTPKIKEAILMAAWALALADEDLDAGEADILNYLALSFGFDEITVEKLKDYARFYILDRALDRFFFGGTLDKVSEKVFMNLTRKIGLNDNDALKAIDLYKKRNNIK